MHKVSICYKRDSHTKPVSRQRESLNTNTCSKDNFHHETETNRNNFQKSTGQRCQRTPGRHCAVNQWKIYAH